jgi:hypothetical protein
MAFWTIAKWVTAIRGSFPHDPETIGDREPWCRGLAKCNCMRCSTHQILSHVWDRWLNVSNDAVKPNSVSEWTIWETVCKAHGPTYELCAICAPLHMSFLWNTSAMQDSIAHVSQQLPCVIMFYHKRFRSPFTHRQVLQTVCDFLCITDGCGKSDVCFSFGIPHIS